jgi:hypothetical protein
MTNTRIDSIPVGVDGIPLSIEECEKILKEQRQQRMKPLP